MAPDYAKLGDVSVGKEYVIAKVDATEASKTATQVGVQGYPTLKFVVNGKPLDYNGQRTLEDMQKWLDNTMLAQLPSITEDKVKELIGTQDFVLIQGASSDQLKVLRFIVLKEGLDFYSIDGSEFKITLYTKKGKTADYNG